MKAPPMTPFKAGEFDDEATKTVKAAARQMLSSSKKKEQELSQRLDQIDKRAVDSVRRGNMSTLNSFVNERGSEGKPEFPHMENDQVRFNMKRLLATDDQIAGNRMTRSDLARNYAIAVRMVDGLKDSAPAKKSEAKADEEIAPAAKPETKTRDHKGRFVPEQKVEKNPSFSAEEVKPDLVAIGGREGLKLRAQPQYKAPDGGHFRWRYGPQGPESLTVTEEDRGRSRSNAC